jgi:hypothetical protein
MNNKNKTNNNNDNNNNNHHHQRLECVYIYMYLYVYIYIYICLITTWFFWGGGFARPPRWCDPHSPATSCGFGRKMARSWGCGENSGFKQPKI